MKRCCMGLLAILLLVTGCAQRQERSQEMGPSELQHAPEEPSGGAVSEQAEALVQEQPAEEAPVPDEDGPPTHRPEQHRLEFEDMVLTLGEGWLTILDRESGASTSHWTDYALWQDDWVVTVSRASIAHSYGTVAQDYNLHAHDNPVEVVLWLQGRPALVQPVPELFYTYNDPHNQAVDRIMGGGYDPEAGVVELVQPTLRTVIDVNSGRVEQQPYFPGEEDAGVYLTMLGASADGRYQVWEVYRGMLAMIDQNYAVYVENTNTGEKQYLYHDARDHLRELLFLTESNLLYRGSRNAFYDLRTGVELNLQLQFPAGSYSEWDWGMWPRVVGFAEIPELGVYVTARSLPDHEVLTMGDIPNQQLALECFDRQGRLLGRIETPFRTWPDRLGAAQYAGVPGRVTFTRMGTHLLFVDQGTPLMPESYRTEEDRQRIVDLDVETMTWRTMRGDRWIQAGDTFITGHMRGVYDQQRNLQETRLHLYKYVDGQLRDMLNVPLSWEACGGSWSISYEQESNSVLYICTLEEDLVELRHYFTDLA